MKYFVVCTRGCTASRWLSRSLERLGGFECSHGTSSLTDFESGEYRQDELVECIHREWFERQATSLTDYLEGNVRDAAMRFSGNVHRYQVARHHSLFQRVEGLPVANVVRHPVTWLDSRTALFRSLMEFVPHLGQQLYYTVVSNFDALWPFSRRFGLSLTDPEVLAFVANVAALYELEKDAQLMGTYPAFPMEHLCTDAGVFSDLVTFISDGQYRPDDEELLAIFGAGKFHQHREQGGTEADTFRNWPEWKKRLAVPQIVRTGLAESYQAFGYDWSFLEDSPDLMQAETLISPMRPFGPYWITVDD